MSDYEGIPETAILPTPPGKPVRARKPRAKKERKDNVDVTSTALPDGYTTMMINNMEVLVKKPAVNVQPTKPIQVPVPERKEVKVVTPPNSVVETNVTSKVKKQRKTSYWNLMIKQYGMPKKGTAAYEELKKEYAAYKERNAPKVY